VINSNWNEDNLNITDNSYLQLEPFDGKVDLFIGNNLLSDCAINDPSIFKIDSAYNPCLHYNSANYFDNNHLIGNSACLDTMSSLNCAELTQPNLINTGLVLTAYDYQNGTVMPHMTNDFIVQDIGLNSSAIVKDSSLFFERELFITPSIEDTVSNLLGKLSTIPDRIGFEYNQSDEKLTVNIFFIFNGTIKGEIINIGDNIIYNKTDE
jgi:hypothetical protein